MTTPDKFKALFGDLGKPTLRGVRKCPKCGTYNGTRGISCKNTSCDVVFKEKERKRGHSADAVKIITGSTEQVFQSDSATEGQTIGDLFSCLLCRTLMAIQPLRSAQAFYHRHLAVMLTAAVGPHRLAWRTKHVCTLRRLLNVNKRLCLLYLKTLHWTLFR